jgi:hypothetical protein
LYNPQDTAEAWNRGGPISDLSTMSRKNSLRSTWRLTELNQRAAALPTDDFGNKSTSAASTGLAVTIDASTAFETPLVVALDPG